MRSLFFIIAVLFSYHCLGQTAEFTLDNGLKVIIKEDHRAPVAVTMVWYKVGSADEHPGNTGLSHALEHFMFKGTPRFPVGVFSKTIAKLGGQDNAFTNNDYTAYYEKSAANHLPLVFELEADRMRNLLWDEKEFNSELNVIREERRLRTDDNPQALTFERFLAAAHLASPYHHPVIGWMEDLQHMTMGDAKTWYENYYLPNNAVVVVVGDVNSQAVYQLAKKYFGAIQRGIVPPRKPQQEPPQLGQKAVEVKAHAQVPFLMLGFTVPTLLTTAAHNPSPYVLEVIASILSAGDSSRLSKHIIREKQIASSVEAYYNLYARYETQFLIYATPSQSHSLTELKQTILNEIKQLQNTVVSKEELDRVKNQIIAQKVFEKDSIFGQAMELGLLNTIGLSSQTAADYIPQIQAVTPEQIQQVAKQYFLEKNMTQAVLIPNKAGEESSTWINPSKTVRKA